MWCRPSRDGARGSYWLGNALVSVASRGLLPNVHAGYARIFERDLKVSGGLFAADRGLYKVSKASRRVRSRIPLEDEGGYHAIATTEDTLRVPHRRGEAEVSVVG